MVYRKNGYKPHYLDSFKKKPYKTWEQLDREQAKRDKKNAKRKDDAVEAGLIEEALDKERAVKRAERSARKKERNYEPSPEPEETKWTTV